MPRIKIIYTICPPSDAPDGIRDLLKSGDLVGITAGHPQYVEGTTNMIQVKRL